MSDRVPGPTSVVAVHELADPVNRPALRHLAFDVAFAPILAGIVHDLRNQLQSVTGVLPLVLAGDGDDVPPTLRTLASNGVEKGLSAVAGLSVLMEFRRDAPPGPTSVTDLMTGALQLHGFRRRADGITTEAHCTDTPPIACNHYDATCAVMCVLNNAVDAIAERDGGEITARTSVRGQDVMIEILDDGPGFDGLDVESALAPFATTRDGHAGLGLPVARGLISGAGGSLAIATPEGGGTQVTMCVPAWSASA